MAVRDNASNHRYELLVDDKAVGSILYRLQPDAVALIHTDIDPQFEGQGLGARLVEGALTDIRERGLGVVPICPFVLSYLDRHPEYRDLVASDAQEPD